jgi:hypothetical protein
MKKILLLGTICFVCFSFSCSQAHSTKSPNFQWLTGKWERINIKAPKKAYEEWHLDNEGKLTGKGWMMIGQDTTFVEKLAIVERDDEWFYIADVSHNSEPTPFKMISWGKESFVSENPTHDFPKKISYSLENSVLTATISGNGKSMSFLFNKVAE